MTKRLLALALAIAAIVAVTACGSDDDGSGGGGTATGGTETSEVSNTEGAPAEGGKMVVGAASGIPQLNPVLKGTAFEEALFPLLWNGLTKIDQDGEVAGDLATEWESSQGGSVWTFELREGVEFSNGKPVDAKAVVKTLDYYKDPDTATQLSTALAPITEVRAEGPTTVVFELEKPNVLLPEVLVPVKIVEVGSLGSIDRDPAVTGPFMVEEFTPEDHITLVRNPSYFGDPAPLDELELVKAADSTSAVTSLRSGDLDVLWSVPSSDVSQIEGDSALQVIKPAVTGQYVSWEMDLTSPPFDNPKAREALAYSIDREAILAAAYYDQGFVSNTNTPLAENSPWFGGELNDFSYDLEKADELFEEAGVDSFTWWGVAGQYPEWNTSAQILQQGLKEIGVEMKIENVEISTWPAKFYPAGKKFPGLVVPNFQSFAASPYFQLGFLLEGRCECNWNSKEFDSTFNQALATADEAKRDELWNEAQELINKEVPLIIPVQSMTETAAQANVVGLWVEASGTPHLESAGFAG